MADQENIKPLTEQELDEASTALGRAWGLAETLCLHSLDARDFGNIDIEGVMRVVSRLVKQAQERLSEGSEPWAEVGSALAVCELVLVDSQEFAGRWQTSVFAIEAVPGAIQRAKEVVDAAFWESVQRKAA